MSNIETKQQYESAILQQLIENAKKLAGIEFKFTQIEPKINKIDVLEEKVDNLETRFDGLETRFDGLETRFDVTVPELYTIIGVSVSMWVSGNRDGADKPNRLALIASVR